MSTARPGSMMPCLRRIAAALLGLSIVPVAPFDALANCKPKKPRPTIVLRTMGPCAFDAERLSFAGDPAQQAACLTRPVAKLGKLGPVPEALPAVLAERVGQADKLPPREALAAHLGEQGLAFDFAAFLWQPLARARDNDPAAPEARYLVIHDTSGPFLGFTPFPRDIDIHRKINNLAGHRCADGWNSAHVIINRSGGMLLGHELSVPWRATKFERAVGFAGALKGLFLHVELIQPRRGRGGTIAPVPGFTREQYDRLALVYVIASVRAGQWIIPATHAVIDNHIRNGHDDPQNFELASFADSLERLAARLRALDEPLVSTAPPDPQASGRDYD